MPLEFNIKYFIFAFAILGTELFFSICSLIGFGYDGTSESSLFTIYCLVLYSTVLILSIKDLRKSKNKQKKTPLLLVPLIFTLFFCIDYVLASRNGAEWTLKSYQLFLVLSTPMIFLGVYLSNDDKFSKLIPYLNILMLVISSGIIITLPRLMTLGIMTTNGENSDYNSISYYSAFCFGYFYYSLLSKNNYGLLFFQKLYFKCFIIFLLVCLAICAAVSGGRGGMVLLIIYFIIVPLLLKKNYTGIFIIYLFVGVAVFLIVNYFMSSNSEIATYLDYGINRAFEYLSSDGVDMSKTSNRDESYSLAWSHIQESPLFGYGFFRTIGEFGYPHNIFLEILLDGGLVLFFIALCVLVAVLRNLVKMIKSRCDLIIIIPLLYTSISLLFGGSYLFKGIFWFCISYILSLNVKQIKNKTNESAAS